MARILIIDDEIDLAELYRLVLEGAGHQILGIFDNPEEVLSLPAGRLDPEIVVLDERLRGRSGMAFLPGLRAAFPRARILFASADPDAVEVSVLRCADAARKKPFPLGELLWDIQTLIHSPAAPKKCQETGTPPL
jgi:DNA-binding response OmpR family regulator